MQQVGARQTLCRQRARRARALLRADPNRCVHVPQRRGRRITMKRGVISRRHLLRGIGNVADRAPAARGHGHHARPTPTPAFPSASSRSSPPMAPSTTSGVRPARRRASPWARSSRRWPRTRASSSSSTGVYQKHANGDAHTDGMGAALTGMPIAPTSNSTGYATGISIDQVIAKDIGKTTKLSSLELAVGTVVNTVWGRLSYLGNNQPIPPEGDPAKAFVRLFGATPGPSSTSAPNGAQILRDQRKTVLDSVLEDYGSLSKRLGTSDRSRVDAAPRRHPRHRVATRRRSRRQPWPALRRSRCPPPTSKRWASCRWISW